MESIEKTISVKEQIILDALSELEEKREEAKASILKEAEETVLGGGAVHRAYIKAVEFVFDFAKTKLEKSGLQLEIEGSIAEIEESTKDRFETIQETEVSPEEAFDFGYKTASIEIRNLQTL
jgi:uncharacterized protein YutE (UPF0331/DUF86 family)